METYCFASAIMTNDEGQRLVEFYDDLVFGTKGTNALDEHLHRRGEKEQGVNFDLTPNKVISWQNT